MRSRYAAFAVGDADYLRATWHPDTRPRRVSLDPEDRWTRLEVLCSTGGGLFDSAGTVVGTGTLSTTNGETTETFSTTSLTAGDHNITALYEGDSESNGSTSPTLVQTVNPRGRGT